jgi:PAS domain S-box-containing protein
MAPNEDTNETGPVNILIVDDHAENRLALKAILSGGPYRIVEAASGPAALLRLLEDEFAVLLLDVVMPDMSGFELARAIREREATATVPIIFVTAEATEASLNIRGYQVGAVDYLVKPLIPEMVRAKVSAFVEIFHQKRRALRQARLKSDLELLELRVASERRYRALADASPNIIWTALPDGTVDFLNQRWFERTGLSAEQTAGTWEVALHPDDVSECHGAWEEAMRTEGAFEREARLRAADGSYRWYLGRAVPERGVSGQLVTWIGSFTDVDEQKRSHAALAEFKGTLDAVLDAIAIFDPKTWRFLYANHGATVLLGYSSEELSRMSPVELMTDYDAQRFIELLAPLLVGDKSALTIETRYRRKDGRVIPVEISFERISVDGGRIVSIARDITDRKGAEIERELLYRQAVDAVRARDEFLSIASHELRTPLSSLTLQLDMLVRPPQGALAPPLSPDQVKEKLAVASRQVERLSRLITQLMDLSRIRAGHLTLEPEPVDLSALVRDVAARFADEAEATQSPLAVSADSPAAGQWDRLRMEQVATNLLTNALKFGSGKPIEVSVTEAGPVVRLCVRDHGIGIAPEENDRIFQRFERGAAARAFGGMGLGLYIVRQIVEAHGGTIRVESQPRAGSTFTVELPREPPARREDLDFAEAHPDH